MAKEKPARNRVIKLEHPGGGRRSVYVPVKRRAARFLEALAESGNVSLACDVAGLRRDRAYLLRKDDAGFAAGWAAAKAAFEAKADAAEETIDEERLRRDGLVVRRGRDGRVQVAKAHPRAWTARAEDAFFAELAATGNVSASARAAGFSDKAAWERARKVSAFRDRLRAAKEDATERLDFYLIEEGTNLLKGEGEPGRRDPRVAMWILKREDQRRAGTLKRGSAAWRKPRPIEEITEEIVRKAEAIRRHREKQGLPPGGAPGADEAGGAR